MYYLLIPNDSYWKYNQRRDEYIYDPQKLGNSILKIRNRVLNQDKSGILIIDVPGNYPALKKRLANHRGIIYKKNNFKLELGPAFGIFQCIDQILRNDICIIDLRPDLLTHLTEINFNHNDERLLIIEGQNQREGFARSLGGLLGQSLRKGKIPNWDDVKALKAVHND